MGINIEEDKGNYELRIFELKAGKIDMPAADQLKGYLDGWKDEKSARSKIKNWILELGLDKINDRNIDEIVDKPQGVLVGPEFDFNAVIKAGEYKFQGIRLTRFKAESGPEYYVIIEDQIGNVIQRAKRQQIGWGPFIQKRLIDESDIFSINISKDEEVILHARPDPEFFQTISKKLIFEKNSASKILDKEKDIRNNAKEYEKKWLDEVIQSIRNEKGVLITHATGIIYLAFGEPKSYWVPGQYWIHEKTKKSLDELKNQLE